MARFGLAAGVFAVWAGVMPGGAARAEEAGFTAFATWLRAGPTEWSKELDELNGGQPVTVLSCANSWCKVMSDGEPGYLPQQLISKSRAPDKTPQPGAACLAATEQKPEGAVPIRVCPAAP